MKPIRTSWICAGIACLSLAAFGCGDDGGGATADAASNVDSAATGPDAQANDAAPADASSRCLAPSLPGTGNHQYVGQQIVIPTESGQSNALALDIDGDGSTENGLGQVVEVFSGSADLGIQQSVDSQVAGGQLLYIANVESSDLVNGAATLRMFLGNDCDSPRDPSDNFSGTELFEIRGDSPTDSSVTGTITAGAVDLGPGQMTVLVPIPDVGNISLPLFGARLVGDITDTGITNAILGGGVKDEDVQSILVPALYTTISTSVATNCTLSGKTCNCDPASSAGSLISLFDSDGNCEISMDEVTNNTLLVALLAPDIDLFDSNNGNAFDPMQDGIADSLSLGVGFTMVNGQFELP